MTETDKFLKQVSKLGPSWWHDILVDGIDIGYGGKNFSPLLNFIGYDKDSKNFDPSGRMPYEDEAFTCVYSSHCLEHIHDYVGSIREWFRILKTGGHLILLLPHQFLYEKKKHIPSRFNADHKRFYTPADLLVEVESSLEPNSYRVRFMEDFDYEFDYSIPPERHSRGNYSIVLVLEKIKIPEWGLE